MSFKNVIINQFQFIIFKLDEDFYQGGLIVRSDILLTRKMGYNWGGGGLAHKCEGLPKSSRLDRVFYYYMYIVLFFVFNAHGVGRSCNAITLLLFSTFIAYRFLKKISPLFVILEIICNKVSQFLCI